MERISLMTMYINKLKLLGEVKNLKAPKKLSPHILEVLASSNYLDSGVFIDLRGSEVILGESVELSDGVRILTHSHEFRNPDWRNMDEVVTDRPTVIGDYAFLGMNSIICPGCKNIGKHSVIGAGAVVTRDVPDYEIWAGNPAVKIGGVEHD